MPKIEPEGSCADCKMPEIHKSIYVEFKNMEIKPEWQMAEKWWWRMGMEYIWQKGTRRGLGGQEWLVPWIR